MEERSCLGRGVGKRITERKRHLASMKHWKEQSWKTKEKQDRGVSWSQKPRKESFAKKVTHAIEISELHSFLG